MPFLVVDGRFPSPIFVFLDADPRAEGGFPPLEVLEVTFDRLPPKPGRAEVGSVGRAPGDRTRFREFETDAAATAAGCELIEPLYVGASWTTYVRRFRPAGGGRSPGPYGPARRSPVPRGRTG